MTLVYSLVSQKIPFFIERHLYVPFLVKKIPFVTERHSCSQFSVKNILFVIERYMYILFLIKKSPSLLNDPRIYPSQSKSPLLYWMTLVYTLLSQKILLFYWMTLVYIFPSSVKKSPFPLNGPCILTQQISTAQHLDKF